MGEVNNADPILVLAGPTASGKSHLAVEVAHILNGEIVNADSRQVYAQLSIGTAKPTEEEMGGIPHHMFDVRSPDERISAGEWAKEAQAVCREIQQRGRVPIVVGGSGLYIQALTDGFVEEPSGVPESISNELQQELSERGAEALYTELESVDPASAALYSDKNPRRVLRALAWFRHVGSPISEAKQTQHPGMQAICFCLFPDRAQLYERINKRTSKMFEQGLVEEVQVLLTKYTPDVQSLHTVGYREVIDYLNGLISLDQAINFTAQKTRNYAKRQYTWFRKRDMQFIEDLHPRLAREISEKYISARSAAANSKETNQQ